MLLLHIEVVLHRLLGIEGIQQGFHLGGVEAGQGDIEFAAVKFGQQGRQFLFVPITLNLVQGNVQGFLALVIQIHDHAIHFRGTEVFHDREALMAADHIAGALVPDHRLHIPEFGNAPLQLFVLRVTGLQGLAGVIRSCPELLHRYFLNLHGQRLRLQYLLMVRSMSISRRIKRISVIRCIDFPPLSQ